ncbi:hypothetical protein COB11_05690 [Candidatus Aerophobetes bacterium]|uniref:Uncharacterized protein n=1 Tax=Aerophobetes bacterium TaxID=2030807 RepID=A0A2A4YES2_UNCAE|nr:MAG: hypothetical protein COB11_05690 [Candidatus Aerophobetes bacterium]
MPSVALTSSQIALITKGGEGKTPYGELISDLLSKHFLKDNRSIEDLQLPMVVTSAFEELPSYFSFYLLCEKRKSVGKFFFEIVSRWAVPGKLMNTSICFAMDFAMLDDLEKIYSIAKVQIPLTAKWDLEVLKRNLDILLQEIKLGAGSTYHAHRILEMRGVSSSQKIGLIQEQITGLMERFPKRFDYDIFTLMQHFFLVSKEEFKAIRECAHLVRVVSVLYFLRKDLIKRIEKLPEKREIFLQMKRARLNLPLGVKNVLAICVGVSFLRENEVFAKRHLARAIQTLLPDVKVVEESYIEVEEGEYPIHLLYLEIEKDDREIFEEEEIRLLKKELPSSLLARVEHLLRPVFMPRNEEEVMRNIIILSHQLKYVKDLPQIMISFDEQTDKSLSFTVIIVRVLDKNSVPLSSHLKMFNSQYEVYIERERKLGRVRNRYFKEVCVLKVKLPINPFLREDDSVDLYAARKEIVMELQKVVGEVRDYNGGMLIKQSETFYSLKKLLRGVGAQHKLLLENFFHAIYPIESRSFLNPKDLKTLFLFLISSQQSGKKGCNLQVKMQNHACITLIEFYDLHLKQNVINEIGKLNIISRKLVQLHLQTVNGIYLGYIYLEHSKKRRDAFLKAVQASLDF